MSPQQRRRMAAFLACMAPAVAGALADEARIPVYQPTTLSQSGHYILTRNITSTSGSAITITAQDVTLDLNGFTITGPPATALVVINSAAGATVRIRNGFLIGANTAISSAASDLSLSLDRIAAFDWDNLGLDIINAAHLDILRSEVRSTVAADTAVSVTGPAGVPVSGRIERSTFSDDAGGVVIVLPKSWVIQDNIFLGSAGVLFFDSGAPVPGTGANLVKDNTFHGNGTGVSISPFIPGNQILGNVITEGASGVVVSSDDNTIAGNLVGGGFPSPSCPGAICVKGARNLVDGNLTEGTTSGCGIAFTGAGATGNAYRLNMLRGNAVAGVCVSGGATATDAGGNIL